MTVKQVYILTSTQPPIQGDERIYGLIGLGETRAMPDLPLCLGVLKHRAPVGQSWGIFLQKFLKIFKFSKFLKISNISKNFIKFQNLKKNSKI